MTERKIPQWKQDAVKDLAASIAKYPTVAIINMKNLPAKQLGKIRSKLRSKAIIKMCKKSIIARALESANKAGAEELAKKVVGMPALMFSELNPFELYSIVKKNRTPAAAKAGQIAPCNILVPAGPTPFTPGPIISQLSGLGIKASIDAGKVVIKSDTLVLKKGEQFKLALTGVLSALGISPMEVGLNVLVALEGGRVYSADVLDVDLDKFASNLRLACLDSFKLAIERGILNSETAMFLITKAELDAKKLAIGADILTPETAAITLAKIEAQAQSLKAKVPEVNNQVANAASAAEA